MSDECMQVHQNTHWPSSLCSYTTSTTQLKNFNNIVVCYLTNHKEAQYADKVFFRVADPVTEVYIKDMCPDTIDLYVFYADDKKCYDTYVLMAEACLLNACKGLYVVATFYVCPGIFHFIKISK